MQPEKYYKNILWVDDFDKKVFDGGDNYDAPDAQDKPDYSSEIKTFFPEHLRERVQVETCADALPGVMEERAKNGRSFDLVVLDINFSSASGRTSDPNMQALFFDKLEKSGINTKALKDPGSTENEKLGYYLMLYLMAGWGLRLEQIALLTGNDLPENDKVSELGRINPANTFKKADFYGQGGPDKAEFIKFLDKTFSLEALTAKAAIIYAKELFYYWKKVYEENAGSDKIASLWQRAYDSQRQSRRGPTAEENKRSKKDAATAIKNYMQSMQSVLEQHYFGREEQPLHTILRNACFLFDDKVDGRNIYYDKNPDAERYLKSSIITLLKAVRNMYSHRVVKDAILPEDFLLLFALAMRALFEPTGIGKFEKEFLPGEQWLIDNLNRKVKRTDENDFTVNYRLLCWYLQGQTQKKENGEKSQALEKEEKIQALEKEKTKEKIQTLENSLSLFSRHNDNYDISDVVKSFCIRAMQTKLRMSLTLNLKKASLINGILNSDFGDSDRNVPYPLSGKDAACEKSIPFDIKSLARVYIESRPLSEIEMNFPLEFPMYL